jgi:hypothetical protein
MVTSMRVVGTMVREMAKELYGYWMERRI